MTDDDLAAILSRWPAPGTPGTDALRPGTWPDQAVLDVLALLKEREDRRAAVAKFLGAASHDLCHVNRLELAAAFGLVLPGGAWPGLPQEEEFRRRCDEYRQQLYGHDGPPDATKES